MHNGRIQTDVGAHGVSAFYVTAEQSFTVEVTVEGDVHRLDSLGLGSWWSLLCFLPYIAVIVVRIINEEKVLEAGLDGYKEYKKRVKYRLLPFVW